MEENMMLNYKLFIEPLKDLTNKKQFWLFFMRKDQAPQFKDLKRWIFSISLTQLLEKDTIYFPKISTS